MLPKSSELSRIQRLSEEISDLMIRRTILKLNVFVNDFLLQETQANFIVLSVSDVLNTRIRLSNRRTVVFSYFLHFTQGRTRPYASLVSLDSDLISSFILALALARRVVLVLASRSILMEHHVLA